MSLWKSHVDRLDILYVAWALVFHISFIAHFSLRKPYFESYTMRFGWIVYALCIPGAIVSLFLMRGGKNWSLWIGGFTFVVFSLFGYWVDYVARIPFRNPFRFSVGVPYVILYLATVMFYWWPIALLSRPLWFVCAALFVISTVLNLRSH